MQIFNNKKLSWFWFIIRIYVGYEWLVAGIDKAFSSAWVGADSGKAISGFLAKALTKTVGEHPDVQWWYADFLNMFVVPFPVFWSHLVTWGEIAVGVALILGAFTAVAAFFGFFMNLNYLLAGTVSSNPVLLVLSIGIMLSSKTMTNLGLDRYIPKLFSSSKDK